jgi:DNA-binding HxlR family transcriptional regulator
MNLQVIPMALKWTADRAKQESEHVVVRELTKKSPQRWSDLLKNTQISSRTLKKALNRLEEKGLVYRNVEQGQAYPPPVLYGLSLEGKKSGGPMLFAANARPYVLGLSIQWEGRREKDQGPASVILHLDTEKENVKDRIALIGKRLGVLQLFALLKALENGNMDWLHETEGFLSYDPFIASVLDFRDVKGHFSARVQSIDGELVLPIPRITDMPEQEEVKRLRDLLEQIFPEEIKAFEEILSSHKVNQISDE